MSSPTPQIDHIIILVPYAYITTPPAWITSTFTLSPGGQHADGKTENRLILLADGSYIELIAFIDDDPARRAGHWWDKPYGIVDWALTNTEDEAPDVEGVNERLERVGSKVRYQEPIRGGRTRPDGVQMEWRVTFPQGVGRGFVPFWCHDVTERERRVPSSREEAVRHPCGAKGVAGVRVGVEEERVRAVRDAVGAIVGGEQEGKVGLGAPRAVEGLRGPWVLVEPVTGGEGSEALKLELVLQVPSGQDAPRDIRQRVGEGEVAILFEKV